MIPWSKEMLLTQSSESWQAWLSACRGVVWGVGFFFWWGGAFVFFHGFHRAFSGFHSVFSGSGFHGETERKNNFLGEMPLDPVDGIHGFGFRLQNH